MDGAVIKQVIQKARSLNKVCIVDPKGSDWSKYEESTIITPNLKRIVYLSRRAFKKNENSVLEEKCFGICEKLKIDYLLITRSEKGMTLIDRNNHYKHYESKARKYMDVSGAGDTVVAAAGDFYEEGIEKSVEIANMTAGIAVGKRGTATVSLE